MGDYYSTHTDIFRDINKYNPINIRNLEVLSAVRLFLILFTSMLTQGISILTAGKKELEFSIPGILPRMAVQACQLNQGMIFRPQETAALFL